MQGDNNNGVIRRWRALAHALLMSGLAWCGAPAAGAWESVFLSHTNGAWGARDVSLGGHVFRLDDYSYVGYRLFAEEPEARLPTNRISLCLVDGSDLTTNLQAAVTELAARGGGLIELPTGRFTITSTVFVTTGNLGLRGQGSSSTTVDVAAVYTPTDTLNESPICFRGGPGTGYSMWSRTNCALVACAVTADVARGSREVAVGSTAGLATGDWVVVQQYFWPEFSARNGNGAWPTQPSNTSDLNLSFTYARQVEAVRAGGWLTLDAPLPRDLNLNDNTVRLFKPNPADYLENVGLAGVTLNVISNDNGVGENVGRPAGIGLAFVNVFNGWARDVVVRNVAKMGFQPTWSARISFLDCAAVGVQDMGGGGFGYGFHTYASQNILYRRCNAYNGRHNFSNQKAMSSMVVFTRCCSFKTPNVPNSDQDDTHTSYSHAILWDALRQTGGVGLEAVNRGTVSPLAYETFGGGAVWNLYGDGNTSNIEAGKVQLSPATYGYGDAQVIGVWGGHQVYDGSSASNGYRTGVHMTNVAAQAGPRGNVAYEGLGQAGLTPYSLFEAQVMSRPQTLAPLKADWGDAQPAAGGVMLQWPAVTGWFYSVQATDRLVPVSAWTRSAWTNRVGADGWLSWSFQPTQAVQYYRLSAALSP